MQLKPFTNTHAAYKRPTLLMKYHQKKMHGWVSFDMGCGQILIGSQRFDAVSHTQPPHPTPPIDCQSRRFVPFIHATSCVYHPSLLYCCGNVTRLVFFLKFKRNPAQLVFEESPLLSMAWQMLFPFASHGLLGCLIFGLWKWRQKKTLVFKPFFFVFGGTRQPHPFKMKTG